ncbi:MAG: T9SS type A sorting domain-containing protein [Bacteroidota bacterium]
MTLRYLILLLSSLGYLTIAHTQQLGTWKLTPSALGEGDSQNSSAECLPLIRGNGLSGLLYASSGVSAKNWATALKDETQADFYEFGIQAKPTATLDISQLDFSERRSSAGPLTFMVSYSKDDWATAVTFPPVTIPDNIFPRNHTFPIGTKIADGEKLRVRLYAYDAESSSGSWTISSNSLRISGTSLPTCTAPSSSATVVPTQLQPNNVTINLQAGSGDGRLVVLAPADEALPQPYQGDSYLGNFTYGQGECLAGRTHVITATSSANSQINIQGLEAGASYQLAVFEYQTGSMCYAPTPSMLTFTTPCTDLSAPIRDYTCISLHQRLALRWDNPFCNSRTLVVVSASPITGSPSTLNINGNERFGYGNEVAGLSPGSYAVYHNSNDDPITVWDLTNDQQYYFAIYTRLGNQWSTPVRFTATPKEGCPLYEYERIFLNEIHYNNEIIPQDQGIEVAGAAGVDLSNYMAIVYQTYGNVNHVNVEINRHRLYGLVDDEGAGYGAVWFPIPNRPSSRGHIKLVNQITGEVLDWVTYSPSSGLRHKHSFPIQQSGPYTGSLIENNNTPAGYALQLLNEEICPIHETAFAWGLLPHTRGLLNAGQQFLPVELTLLAAEAKGATSRVYWQTASEENSDYFLLERSADGRIFQEISKVTAAGFSQSLLDYEWVDAQPLSGKNYYRLRQVDFDGTVHDHGIVTVDFAGITDRPLLFPNPVVDHTTINWYHTAHTLRITDATGREVRRLGLDNGAEGGSQNLNLSDLPQGVYLLQLDSRDGVKSLKLFKQ